MIDPGGAFPAAGSLAGLDVGPDAERGYRALVAAGAVDRTALPGVLGMRPDRAAATLDALVAASLVRVDEQGAVEAVSPQLALGGTIAARERSLADARSALDQLTEQYRQARDQQNARGIEIVRGREEIRHWIDHLLVSATTELRLFAKPPFQVNGVEATETEAHVATRGIRERLVIEWGLLEEPNAESSLIASLDRGQDIRMVPSLPAKLLIADDSLAIVQLDSGGQAYSEHALVRPSGLLDCIMFVFESVWRGATQLREAPGKRIDPPTDSGDPVDREVLTLLLAGHTDAAVAARLGVGLRTVQRRVRRLMDLAGTDSRVVLGWHARDRGWL